MKIVTNPKLIQRNYKIGMYTTLASLLFLIAAVALTVPGMFNPQQVALSGYSPLAMLVGLITSQVGMYYANRYGKSPRVDERLTQGLKGLDDRYTLYHYVTPAPHVLAGPAGIWVIAAQYQGGAISYEKGRYRQKGVGFFSRYVGQEAVGRPELEAQAVKQDFVKFLTKKLPETSLPPVESVIVYTNPKATVQAPDAPIPTMHVEKFKEYVRKAVKAQPTAVKSVDAVKAVLPEDDVA